MGSSVFDSKRLLLRLFTVNQSVRKDIGICPFQMSNNVSGEFSSLNPTGNEIKRWKIGQVPEITRSKATFVSKVQHQNIISTTESSGNDSQIKINSHLFVSSIIITKYQTVNLAPTTIIQLFHLTTFQI